MALENQSSSAEQKVGRMEQTQLSGGDRLSQDGAGWEGAAKKCRSNKKLAGCPQAVVDVYAVLVIVGAI